MKNMKDSIASRLEATSERIRVAGRKAMNHPIASILSLCMVAGSVAMTAVFSQEKSEPCSLQENTIHSEQLPMTRVITSTDGKSMAGNVLEIGGGVIQFSRASDGVKVEIPLSMLSESDRIFFESWQPAPSYRPSSVSISGSPSLARGSYPSQIQPIYSSAGYGGVRGHTTTVTRSCRYIGSRTVVVTPNCPKCK